MENIDDFDLDIINLVNKNIKDSDVVLFVRGAIDLTKDPEKDEDFAKTRISIFGDSHNLSVAIADQMLKSNEFKHIIMSAANMYLQVETENQ